MACTLLMLWGNFSPCSRYFAYQVVSFLIPLPIKDWTLLVSMLLENNQPSDETVDPTSTLLTVAEEQLLLHVLLASAEVFLLFELG